MFQKFQIIAAPLAGVTDQPFRQILQRINPGLPVMTEMISCHSITSKQSANSLRNADKYHGQNTGAQIFGSDANLMADAAKILEDAGAAWIDINMGCPVPKVATRAMAGAFLMRDHALAGRIMNAVVRAVKIPVSIKTRLGWDEAHLDTDNLLHIAAESGIAFATVHARTRAQGYSGTARLAEIPMPQKIPIVFNGDIKTAADIEKVKTMGASGAMIGRAMLGRPLVFQECGVWNVKCGVGNRENCSSIKGGASIVKTGANSTLQIPHSTLILEHFDLMLSYYGHLAVPMFRKHAAWYAAGRQGAGAFRVRVNQITTATEMQKAIREFFAGSVIA